MELGAKAQRQAFTALHPAQPPDWPHHCPGAPSAKAGDMPLPQTGKPSPQPAFTIFWLPSMTTSWSYLRPGHAVHETLCHQPQCSGPPPRGKRTRLPPQLQPGSRPSRPGKTTPRTAPAAQLATGIAQEAQKDHPGQGTLTARRHPAGGSRKDPCPASVPQEHLGGRKGRPGQGTLTLHPAGLEGPLPSWHLGELGR